jgi:hypothetical protein
MSKFLYNWSGLKRLERIELIAIVTLIPGVYLLSALLELIGMPSTQQYSVPVWLAAVFILDMKAMNFTCPQRKSKFFYKTWFKNRFTSKCLHCGLPKWAHEGQSPQEYRRLTELTNSSIGSE